MTIAWLTRGRSDGSGGRALERTTRLVTGLILFGFAATHLTNHMFGIRSIEAMEAASRVLLDPWQTVPGLVVLYLALVIHLSLGLRALYRRRHFRIPPAEAWQLGLGLAIPLLLIPHAAGIRIGTSLYGAEFGYPWIMHNYFVASPDIGLPRQVLLLLVLWLHGCLGVRAWLRSKPWWPRVVTPLGFLAILVPLLALIGLFDAGREMAERVQNDPAYAARFAAPESGTPAAENDAARQRLVDTLLLSYLGLVVGTLALRTARNWRARLVRAVRVSYRGGSVVIVPTGFSVLEASRWAGIPHASVCGGRGRCSTCRVRVLAGSEHLPPLSEIERGTLARFGLPPDLRLACQIRPTADLAVEPLVAPAASDRRAARFGAAVEGGRELMIAALFIDLRESTQIASRRLPFDALFLLDRYIGVVTGAIRGNGGRVTSIAGDGVMCMFGGDGDASRAARDALKAALQSWDLLDRLSDELGGELLRPLRVGIGIHLGLSVVGRLHDAEFTSLQFLGDVGNTAAKLEAKTKELGCTLLVSLAALAAISPNLASVAERAEVALPGKPEAIPAAVVRTKRELQEILASSS
jgi:adenylate cyclase